MANNGAYPKQYLITFLTIFFLGLGLLVVTSIYIQPLEGDLTRMGGYSERDFGWNIPRMILSDNVKLANKYDKYYDIVVLGDSFSNSGIWQTILANNTNLSFVTLHWDQTNIDDILNNPFFRKNPPKLLIAETGIRAFPLRFSSENKSCELINETHAVAEIALENNGVNSYLIKRQRNTETHWSEINLNFALTYIKNSFLRLAVNNDFTRVKKYKLNRSDLFSNRASNEILLLNTWFDSKLWSEEDISKAICFASNIQNKVQSNGKTYFMLLSIPDKGTVYRNYVSNPEYSNVDRLTNGLSKSDVNVPKLESNLFQAIEHGEKDVYLPNDTHFGTKGYEITAQSILNLISDNGEMALSSSGKQ